MRKVELKKNTLTLTHNKIDGFLDRTVTKLGTSAKVDCPKKYIGQQAYLIICKEKTKKH